MDHCLWSLVYGPFKPSIMKRILFLIAFMAFAGMAGAQVQQARLQASGLTCSMCSKAVLNALQKVPGVKAVEVNIDRQEYILSFQESPFELDALSKAVEDAGFSVSALSVTTNVSPQKLEKDKHIDIGGKTFHFLNGAGRELPATATFRVVDKAFVSDKEFKKVSSLSAMACVKTGKMEACCSKKTAAQRVYHVLL